MLESSADGIFILDPRLCFVGFNRACARMTGLSADEAIGREHAALIRWLRREPGLALEQAVAAGWPLLGPGDTYVEGDLLKRGGEALSVGITYAPALSADGKLRSIVGNLRDITKFREAEEVKSTFISIISHELRTPVALIKGYVGTLRREDAQWDPAIVRDSLAVIEEESDRLAELIDDLLEASRLQAGGLALQARRCRAGSARPPAGRTIWHADQTAQLRGRFPAGLPSHRRRRRPAEPGAQQPALERREVLARRRHHHGEWAGPAG